MRFILLYVLCIGYTSIAQNAIFDKESFEHKEKTLNYRVLKPIDFDESKQYPLHVFLHGSGERGNDNEAQLVHGSQLFIDQNTNYPAIVIFPQCPKDDYWAQRTYSRDQENNTNIFTFPKQSEPTWAMSAVMGLIDTYLEKEYIDTDRVYISGLSMGGMGTFELLSRRPTLFAAATPICGAGNIENVALWSNETPVWIFHGDDDTVVPSYYSKIISEAILKAGNIPKLTIYPEVGHNSWDHAFVEKEFFAWIYSHKRK